MNAVPMIVARAIGQQGADNIVPPTHDLGARYTGDVPASTSVLAEVQGEGVIEGYYHIGALPTDGNPAAETSPDYGF